MAVAVRKMKGVYLIPFLTIATAACSSIFTYPRNWSAPLTFPKPQRPDAIEAAAKDKWAHFPSDLRACVAAHDPSHLADLDEGHKYRISGWFIDRPRTDEVIQCMTGKGWAVDQPFL
jgi:hypothetical protein